MAARAPAKFALLVSTGWQKYVRNDGVRLKDRDVSARAIVFDSDDTYITILTCHGVSLKIIPVHPNLASKNKNVKQKTNSNSENTLTTIMKRHKQNKHFVANCVNTEK